MVNRSKEGEILHQEISQAQSNARYVFDHSTGKTLYSEKKPSIKQLDEEEKYLKTVVKKSNARITQIARRRKRLEEGID